MLYVQKLKKVLNVTTCENYSDEIVSSNEYQISIADTSSQSTTKSRVSLPWYEYHSMVAGIPGVFFKSISSTYLFSYSPSE